MAMRVMRVSSIVSCCSQGVSGGSGDDSLVAVVPAVVAARDRAAGPDRPSARLRAEVQRGLLPGVEAGGVDIAVVGPREAGGHRREVLHGVFSFVRAGPVRPAATG